MSGEVVHGKGIGKTVGMPTANLYIQHEKLPCFGVYASIVHVRGVIYLGATHVGYILNFDNKNQISVETFIIDFQGDLYGDLLQIDLHHYLRPTLKLKSLSAVQQQVSKDCVLVKELLGDSLKQLNAQN